MKAKHLMIITIAAMLAACSNDEDEANSGPVEARIMAGIEGPVTRAADDSWTAADAIGVRVTETTSGVDSKMKTLYKNVKYTTEKGGISGTFEAEAGQGIFFQDAGETVTFAAYSPYKESTDDATLPGTDGTFSGGSTQDQSSKDKQEALDYLFAGGATASRQSPTVEFKGNDHQFKHRMSRLILVLKTATDKGFTADQVFGAAYKLGGLKHAGNFNVTNGTATATGNAVSDWMITDNVKVDDKSANTRTYTMILYPQSLASALTFSATIDGQTYTNSKAIKPALDAGTSYTYEITMKKTGLTVSGCTIGAWIPGTGGTGDAEM